MLTALAVGVAGLPVMVSAAPVPATMAAAETATESDTERPDAVSAMVSARAVGHRVEDVSQRSETTLVFANPEGSWTAESASGPVRAQDEAGTWAGIDTDLVKVVGGYAPANVPGELVISDGGEKTFAAMEVEGRDLGWRWPTVLPAPVIDGASATYAGVVDGGDLVVTATPSGFRHDIVLNEAPADPVSFQISIVTGGPAVDANPDGSLEVKTAAGDTLVTASAPVMYDASDTVSGQPDETLPVEADVSTSVTGGVLTLSPDQAFLADPTTVYPVTIDPTVSQFTGQDTWTDSGNPTVSNVSSTELRAGTPDSGTHKYRSFLVFGNKAWFGHQIIAATLKMANFASSACSGEVRAYRVTTSWTSGITWNTMPTATSADSAVTNMGRGFTGCAAGDLAWDVTPIVQGWSGGTFANYGLRVGATSETGTNTYRRFWSIEHGTDAEPRLSVTYSTPPSTAAVPTTAASRTFDGKLFVGNARPVWMSSATDPELTTVKVTTEARTSTSAPSATASCTSGYVGSGRPASCTPAQSLNNNTDYVVRSRATDVGGTVGPWSAWRSIRTDLTVPTTPSLSCTGVADKNWYETRPAASTACTMAGNGSDLEYQLNGQSQPDLAPSATTTVNIPMTGFTNIAVRSRTRAGAVSAWATVGFGTGPASLLSPIIDDRSSSTFPVEAAAPPGAASARVQWRFAPETTGTPDPDAGWADASQVLKASDGTGWTGAVSGTDWSTTPKLVWDPQAESGISSTALVEVRVVFTYAGSVEKASPLQRVQVVPHAFGGSFPTDAAGPGQVALFTGEFQMSETDVSVPGYGGALSLGRSHLSLAGTPAGPAGVFGPGWKADLSGPDEGVAGFTVTDRTVEDGSLTLAAPEGDSYLYRHDSGTAGAQKVGTYVGVGETALDDDTLKLVTVTGETGVSHRLTLTEWDGTKTIFVRTNGVWTTEKVIGVEDASTTSYTHDGDGSVTWIFAPTPAGVSCDATSQQPGCRALHLNYTGTGTDKRLTSIDLRIYDPHTGSDGLPGTGAGMDTITVAKYAYDTGGQLIASWDPRVADGASALKTEYAYDPGAPAGHTRLATLTEPGLKPWNYNYDTGGWISTITRAQDPAVGGTATWTIGYDLALSGTGLPDLTAGATATWGQPAADAPASGAAVFGPDHPAANDYEYASLSYWTKSGRVTNAASFGAGKWQIGSQRYDENGNTVWSLDGAGRNQALAEGATPEETAGAADKYSAFTLYNTDGTRVEETYSPTGDFVLKDGTPFTGRTLTQTVYDGEADAAGYTDGRPTTDVPAGGFDLPVREFASATDAAGPSDGPASANIGVPRTSRELDSEETRTFYDPVTGDGDGWELKSPTRVSTQDGSGWSTTSTRFDTEGKVTETRSPESNTSTGSAATARTMQSVYYTTDTSASRSECRSKPQWAGQVCWHGTAGNPSTGAAIPATTTSGFSTLLAPTRTEESSGAATRTSIAGYDPAGRPVTTSLSTSGLATADRAVPSVSTTYSPTTGAPTTLTNGTQTQASTYDTWGRVTSQTDGTGNTATTTYDTAGRVATAADGKGTYTYTYDGTDSRGKKERRGMLTKLDVGLPTGPDEFTGAYDDNGGLVEQNYPGGTKATWTRDLTGTPTSLAYTQAGTDLLAFTNTLDQAGRIREANGPASKQSYRYDDQDRLTKVEDTTESACTTRVYDFSKDSNRKTLTTHAPSTVAGNEGQCQTATAANTETSNFDDADRTTDTGYTYDPLGRTKTLPDTHTTTTLESPGNLAATYHANDMAATLSQSGTEAGTSVTKSQDFTLDATSRISLIKNLTDTVSLEESTNHYGNGGDSPAWTETKKRPNATTAWTNTWTRNISSLGGDLAIIQASDGASTLQIANLHGDIVSTLDVAATGIDSYADTNEYGNPRGNPSTSTRYGWLGTKQRHSDGITGGLTLMGARLYNPSTGRFLSRDPIEGGNDTSYAYPVDPVNVSDLSGKCPICVPIAWAVAREIIKAAAKRAASRAARAAGKRAAADAVQRAKKELAKGVGTKKYKVNVRRYPSTGGLGANVIKYGKRIFSASHGSWSGDQGKWYRKFYYKRRPGIGKHRPWE